VLDIAKDLYFAAGEETMKANNPSETSEPLLTAVARKLGHAAGALAKVTHELTGSISNLPQDAKEKMSEELDLQGKKRAKRINSGVRPQKKVRTTSRKKTTATPAAKRRVKSKARTAGKR
jgi:hypothetical protein